MAKPPKSVVVFSGKRKSGKDFVSDLLCNRLGKDKCTIMRLSGPLKMQYAKEHSLDFERLLDVSDYKEKYRADMIRWGEEMRNSDPGFFCRHATSGKEADKDVWIISDARRRSDIQYFMENYTEILITVRVEADLDVREKRGFVFTSGVDDAESECGLDSGVEWTIVINNNGDEQYLTGAVDSLCNLISL